MKNGKNEVKKSKRELTKRNIDTIEKAHSELEKIRESNPDKKDIKVNLGDPESRWMEI